MRHETIEQKSQTMFCFSNWESIPSIQQALFDKSRPFALSWSHYLILMRIKNELERRFYEIEATKGHTALCKEKHDSVVELTLPKDSNIYASEYSLYLPDKSLLQSKLAEWIEEFEEEQKLRMLERNASKFFQAHGVEDS